MASAVTYESGSGIPSRPRATRTTLYRLFQQHTCAVQVAGTERGPARHGRPQQLGLPGKVGRLQARTAGHVERIGYAAGQQQRADMCVGDVEPHVRSVQRAGRDLVSRLCDVDGLGGAARVRGYWASAQAISAPTTGMSSNARFFDACTAASGWSIANQ